MSMKNSNYTIGNRNRDLSACSAVPQPTAPLHAPREVCPVHVKLEIGCVQSRSGLSEEDDKVYSLPVIEIQVRQKNVTVFMSRYFGNRVGWGNATKVSG